MQPKLLKSHLDWWGDLVCRNHGGDGKLILPYVFQARSAWELKYLRIKYLTVYKPPDKI